MDEEDRWGRHAEIGVCEYCREEDVLVKVEPFGQQPACKPCWEQIVYGE